MKRTLVSISFLLLNFGVFTVFVSAQNETKVDVVKYFDENKRWYND